jgi:hypothetical protein
MRRRFAQVRPAPAASRSGAGAHAARLYTNRNNNASLPQAGD